MNASIWVTIFFWPGKFLSRQYGKPLVRVRHSSEINKDPMILLHTTVPQGSWSLSTFTGMPLLPECRRLYPYKTLSLSIHTGNDYISASFSHWCY